MLTFIYMNKNIKQLLENLFDDYDDIMQDNNEIENDSIGKISVFPDFLEGGGHAEDHSLGRGVVGPGRRL